MNIAIVYFSATGITKKISSQIATVLESEGNSVDLTNIIKPDKRKSQIDFSEFDACIFGFPVFGGRPPVVVEEWLSTLDGKNLKCSMFFTYGARALEWAHQITYYLLTRANFQVVLSAEFIGRHSFNIAEGWSLAEDRPNALDLNVATEFARQSIIRFQKPIEFKIDLTAFTYKPLEVSETTGSWAKFYPSREEEECSMCYLCEKECPTGSFDAKEGKSNRKSCITCMHCVIICPDQVIKIGNVSKLYKRFMKHFRLTEEIVKQKRSKIIL